MDLVPRLPWKQASCILEIVECSCFRMTGEPQWVMLSGTDTPTQQELEFIATESE